MTDFLTAAALNSELDTNYDSEDNDCRVSKIIVLAGLVGWCRQVQKLLENKKDLAATYPTVPIEASSKSLKSRQIILAPVSGQAYRNACLEVAKQVDPNNKGLLVRVLESLPRYSKVAKNKESSVTIALNILAIIYYIKQKKGTKKDQSSRIPFIQETPGLRSIVSNPATSVLSLFFIKNINSAIKQMGPENQSLTERIQNKLPKNSVSIKNMANSITVAIASVVLLQYIYTLYSSTKETEQEIQGTDLLSRAIHQVPGLKGPLLHLRETAAAIMSSIMLASSLRALASSDQPLPSLFPYTLPGINPELQKPFMNAAVSIGSIAFAKHLFDLYKINKEILSDLKKEVNS